MPEDASQEHRKTLSRMMYRAKQRGWLEMDLLVSCQLPISHCIYAMEEDRLHVQYKYRDVSVE